MINVLCVIPSRILSTRLARKPLLPIQGKPMVQWTYENAARCPDLTELVVATDSEDIASLITKIGGKVMLTDPHISNGTERVAAVAAHYPEMDVVINLQGDEPFIKPIMLTQLIAPYLAGDAPPMTTLAYALTALRYKDPGAVKVATDLNNNALYFTRASIPFYRQNANAPVYNHVGLYAFRYDFLMVYKTLTPTPLEKIEGLEQLRVLEHGHKIRVCYTKEKTLEINTLEEYELAQQFAYDAN